MHESPLNIHIDMHADGYYNHRKKLNLNNLEQEIMILWLNAEQNAKYAADLLHIWHFLIPLTNLY